MRYIDVVLSPPYEYPGVSVRKLRCQLEQCAP